jgi:hypothetical protein
MLDFRILSGAVFVAVLIMAGILLSLDPGDVAIATLPRPNVETAIIQPVEPSAPAPQPAIAIAMPKPIEPAPQPAKAVVIPKPDDLAPPPAKAFVLPQPIEAPAIVAARPPEPAANDITASIGPVAAEPKEAAPPPRPRARVAAKKPEPEVEQFNPLKLFFPFVDFSKSPFPIFLKEQGSARPAAGAP